jgi:hypothetical protein
MACGSLAGYRSFFDAILADPPPALFRKNARVSRQYDESANFIPSSKRDSNKLFHILPVTAGH